MRGRFGIVPTFAPGAIVVFAIVYRIRRCSRPLCVAIRTRLAGVSVLFAGWFGPRGLASIVLGLIVVAEAPHLAGRNEIETVVASTVLLSVLLHGITAAPLSAAYARRVGGMASDAPEKQGAAQASARPSFASTIARGSQ